MKIVIIFVLLAVFACVGLGQERYVKPVDEAGEDASFLAFRTKLIEAAERKDAAFILRVLDPKINLSFGGDEGIADFKRIWKISSKNSQFWDEFLPVIKNGGRWRKDAPRSKVFYVPFPFDSFPEDLDSFTHEVIFGSNVNLRESPATDSRVIAKLSYNVVTVETDPDTEAGKIREKRGFSKVKTLGGLEGWIKNELVRSPIDYRAGFEKVWRVEDGRVYRRRLKIVLCFQVSG